MSGNSLKVSLSARLAGEAECVDGGVFGSLALDAEEVGAGIFRIFLTDSEDLGSGGSEGRFGVEVLQTSLGFRGSASCQDFFPEDAVTFATGHDLMIPL